MMANLKMGIKMGKEIKCLVMETSMKVTGNKVKCMEMENLHIKMVL